MLSPGRQKDHGNHDCDPKDSAPFLTLVNLKHGRPSSDATAKGAGAFSAWMCASLFRTSTRNFIKRIPVGEHQPSRQQSRRVFVPH